GQDSGIDIPMEEWSYVALVVEPTGATLYLNEEKYFDARSLSAGNIGSFFVGKGHYSSYFKGSIDEVTVWKRALSEAEIRELRHLTKEGLVDTDVDLLAYYQFNDVVGATRVMDVGGTAHGGLQGNATLTMSTAPVGAGAAHIQNLQANQFTYAMPDVGTELTLSDCESPNGQLVVSRLNVLPDTPPNAYDAVENYWVVNYYDGASPSFDALESISLTPTDAGFVPALNSPTDAIIHLRVQNGEGDNWDTRAAARSESNGALTYDRASSIAGPIQLTLTNGAPPFDEMVPQKYCEVETVAGKALYLNGAENDRGEGSTLNLNTNTFTTSAWIKPSKDHGIAGLLFWRGGSTTSGIHLTTGNEVRYHWDGDKRTWQSGAYAPVGEWTHVALVVEPNQATIYVNGVPYVNTASHPVEAFDTPFLLGDDPCCGGRNFQGEVDEVCVWDRALTQIEIRELMHLTKEDILATDANLQVYLQFNEADGAAYDKTPGKDDMTFVGTYERRASNAPVGGGVSARQTVSSGGDYTFAGTGITLGFPAAGTYPDGEILVSRINLPPDTKPTGGNIVGDSVYWVIRNYGANATFTELDEIIFDEVDGLTAVDVGNPGQFTLYKRASNAYGASWGTSIDDADLVTAHGDNTGSVEYNTGNSLTSFSQFALGDSRTVNVAVRAMLEGPYEMGSMRDDLRVADVIPNGQPYAGHVGGGGEESFPNSLKSVTGNDALVDWVMLELRDENDPALILYT
ncbi:MAG: LamG domain-containing protein, partial [Bacteroidetes bacterium]